MVGLDGFGDLGAYGMTGFRAVMGSWKIMAMLLPRWRRMDSGGEREEIFACKRNVSCYLRGVWK